MRKLIVSIFLSFCFFVLSAQNEPLVKVNSNNNVHLIFDSPIEKASVGNPSYSLIYNPEKQDKIIIVKGLKADQTNLFVICADGLMYNFLLQYSEVINEYYRMVSKHQAINYRTEPIKPVEKLNIADKPTKKKRNRKDTVEAPIEEIDSSYSLGSRVKAKNLYEYDKKEYMRKIASSMVTKGNYFARTISEKNNMSLQLMNIVFNKNEMYFYFEVKNSSRMEFDVEYINYVISTKKGIKRSNTQGTPKEPIYTYQLPKKIKGKGNNRFVVVFEKFTVQKKKVFELAIIEKNGERDIKVLVAPKQINNPNLKF